jgi:hypothetical protein
MWLHPQVRYSPVFKTVSWASLSHTLTFSSNCDALFFWDTFSRNLKGTGANVSIVKVRFQKIRLNLVTTTQVIVLIMFSLSLNTGNMSIAYKITTYIIFTQATRVADMQGTIQSM